MTTATFPSQVNIAIIGGGGEATSHVVHLARAEVTDIAVFDKGDPFMPDMTFPYTGGSSNHSSGLVVPISPGSRLETLGRMYGVEFLSGISEASIAKGGQACFRMTGNLELATSEARVRDLIKREAFGRWCGVESHLISPGKRASFSLRSISNVYEEPCIPQVVEL